MSTTAKLDPQVALAELQARKPDRVTIVVLSGNMDRVMSAFIIATGAASMGMQVTMFFTFWGLNAIRKPGVSLLGFGDPYDETGDAAQPHAGRP